MEGGDLRWFWSHFQMYERIDHVSLSSYAVSQEFTVVKVYSVKGYHEKAGFAPAAGKFYCRL